MIGVEFARDARGRLEEAGLPLEYHEHPRRPSARPAQLPPMRTWVAARTARLASMSAPSLG